MKEAFLYTNRYVFPENAYVIIANLDVFFHKTLLILKSNLRMDRRIAFYLSRYEVDEKFSLFGTKCRLDNYHGSHDALIFQPPISETVANRLNYRFGTWNMESKVLIEFVSAGYLVQNPCKSIRCWHLHPSQSRNEIGITLGQETFEGYNIWNYLRPPDYISSPLLVFNRTL